MDCWECVFTDEELSAIGDSMEVCVDEREEECTNYNWGNPSVKPWLVPILTGSLLGSFYPDPDSDTWEYDGEYHFSSEELDVINRADYLPPLTTHITDLEKGVLWRQYNMPSWCAQPTTDFQWMQLAEDMRYLEEDLPIEVEHWEVIKAEQQYLREVEKWTVPDDPWMRPYYW